MNLEAAEPLLSYLAALLLGGAAGWTELAGRYRDKPTGPLATWAGWTYVSVNALASVLALVVVRKIGLATETGLPVALAQVLLAGVGAMAFFRSAVFNVRLGDADVPVGPAVVLQVILNASDRAYDRRRAADRSAAVTRIMENVAFERAKQALPMHCLTLMQNVSPAEANALGETIKQLDAAQMGPRSKSNNLGLLLMNVVGEETLAIAVNDLRTVIKLPSETDERLLQKGSRFHLNQLPELLGLCRFFEPDRDPALLGKLQAELDAIKAAVSPDEVKAIDMLTVLRGIFGSAVLETALDRLATSTTANQKTTQPP